MRPVRNLWVLVAVVPAVLAGASSWSCGEDEGGGGGGGEPTSSNASSSSGISTAVSSTTMSGPASSGSGGCSAQVGNGDRVCEECAQGSCCAELEAYQGNMGQTELTELTNCVSTACTRLQCFYPICDATIEQNGQTVSIGYFFLNELAECVGGACCQLVKDCLADPACQKCLLQQTQADCDMTMLDEPTQACVDACANGGVGGAGGSGGAGGAAGAGGAGGN